MPTQPEGMDSLTLTVVYDNNPFDKRLKSAWGFSCLVRGREKVILFDTGGDPEILLFNMKELGIDPAEIGLVILSHSHWDHIGGLARFLSVNPKVEVWLPKSFSTGFKARIEGYGAKYREVAGPIRICEGVYSTGEMGTWIKEQSLIPKTDKGLVVITGCAHPGVVEIVAQAKEQLKDEIYLVMGGLHLGGSPDQELKLIIDRFRDLGVERVGPGHCSGDRARELFREEYGEDFVEIGVGRQILIAPSAE